MVGMLGIELFVVLWGGCCDVLIIFVIVYLSVCWVFEVRWFGVLCVLEKFFDLCEFV